jgi:hypothetical protein
MNEHFLTALAETEVALHTACKSEADRAVRLDRFNLADSEFARAAALEQGRDIPDRLVLIETCRGLIAIERRAFAFAQHHIERGKCIAQTIRAELSAQIEDVRQKRALGASDPTQAQGGNWVYGRRYGFLKEQLKMIDSASSQLAEMEKLLPAALSSG